ncbi:alpha-amylase family glycosyl hydrolase [Oceanobacillus halotolerans]|uniref:alpha-amylase family glycosyl hydrolase n=1 Tax=Oceanobacillus halotolerans TaxID=2663380 RepID=UPI0013DAC4FA|nr:alpha-amylase family glycosyl hydrolase [Oceanobacillus halotolerans]
MKKIMIIVAFLLLWVPGPIHAEEQRQVHEEIIYDILVDRFNNGDASITEQVDLDDPFAYHGGDIQGIIDKLDSIKEFGFTTISLSPVMANAPGGYHGYWIDDFYKVDEQFGTMEDVKRLVAEAHDRDMKVILEFVPNYVANTHPIVEDPEREDWIIEGDKPAHAYLDQVVRLNHENEEVQQFLIDAATFWIEEAAIDGLKLHAADQAAPDFLETFTQELRDESPDLYLIADVLETNEDLQTIEGIDLIENPGLYEAMTDAFSQVDTPLTDLFDALEEQDRGLHYVDDPFTERFTKVFTENGRNAVTTWKLALTFLYTTPGAPSIYQGSELPMSGEPEAGMQQMVQFNSSDPDLEEVYHRIAALRTEFPALQYGDMEVIASEGAMSVFKRTYEGETLYIAMNNGSETNMVPITELESGVELKGLMEDDIVRESENGEYPLVLPRETADVYVIQDETGMNWMFIAIVGGIFLTFVIAVVALTRKQKKNTK